MAVKKFHVVGGSIIPQSDFNQTDETQADYIKNKPDGAYIGKKGISEVENATAGEIFNDYKNNIASGTHSHAEGLKTTASGNYSHTEGRDTVASGYASHAEGDNTIANGIQQHVQGRYNIEDTRGKYVHIVGNGASDTNRSNAHTVDWNGNGWFAGDVYVHALDENGDYTDKLATESYVDEEIKNIEISTDKLADGAVTTEKLADNSITSEKVSADLHGVKIGKNGTQANGTVVTGAEVFNSYSGLVNRATGEYSHAEGHNTAARGYVAHAEGWDTEATGDYSHAEGYTTEATGDYSHAEGSHAIASGTSSHAEGGGTASGDLSHAEGVGTASGHHSHAEGMGTTASGDYSHAEGLKTTASGNYSHTEGRDTVASGYASHAEGDNTIASGRNQHVQGEYNIEDTENKYAHIVGNGFYGAINGNIIKKRSNAHTVDWDGNGWFAGDVYVHELDENGDYVTKLATESYVDDKLDDIATNGGQVQADYAETDDTKASYIQNKPTVDTEVTAGSDNLVSSGAVFDAVSNIEISVGTDEITDGAVTTSKLADGSVTTPKIANKAVTEAKLSDDLRGVKIGRQGVNDYGAPVIGAELFNGYERDNSTGMKKNIASGKYSHAEGMGTTASGDYSHAEGCYTTASGEFSHAEGQNTTASGEFSHAEGQNTTASGEFSHAEGRSTIASDEAQHVQGKFNIEDTENKYAHIVGNGTSNTERSNAHTVDWDGNGWFSGDVYVHSLDENNDYVDKLATENYVNQKISEIEIPEGSGEVADGSITTQKLADEAVTTEKIAIHSIIENRIADESIHSYHMAGNSIQRRAIIDGAVHTEKLADGAVTPAKLDRTYLTEHQSLEGYATEDYVDDYVDEKYNDLVPNSQSDYTENDESKLSHIKNRPFYETEVVEGSVITIPEYTGEEVCSTAHYFGEGKEQKYVKVADIKDSAYNIAHATSKIVTTSGTIDIDDAIRYHINSEEFAIYKGLELCSYRVGGNPTRSLVIINADNFTDSFNIHYPESGIYYCVYRTAEYNSETTEYDWDNVSEFSSDILEIHFNPIVYPLDEKFLPVQTKKDIADNKTNIKNLQSSNSSTKTKITNIENDIKALEEVPNIRYLEAFPTNTNDYKLNEVIALTKEDNLPFYYGVNYEEADVPTRDDLLVDNGDGTTRIDLTKALHVKNLTISKFDEIDSESLAWTVYDFCQHDENGEVIESWEEGKNKAGICFYDKTLQNGVKFIFDDITYNGLPYIKIVEVVNGTDSTTYYGIPSEAFYEMSPDGDLGMGWFKLVDDTYVTIYDDELATIKFDFEEAYVFDYFASLSESEYNDALSGGIAMHSPQVMEFPVEILVAQKRPVGFYQYIRNNHGYSLWKSWNASSGFSGSYKDLTDKPDVPTNLADLIDDAEHRLVTDAEKESWNTKSDFSGNYEDLKDKPFGMIDIDDLNITIGNPDDMVKTNVISANGQEIFLVKVDELSEDVTDHYISQAAEIRADSMGIILPINDDIRHFQDNYEAVTTNGIPYMAVIKEENIAIEYWTFPETGVYILVMRQGGSLFYVNSVTFQSFIKTLDNKFISSDIARTVDVDTAIEGIKDITVSLSNKADKEHNHTSNEVDGLAVVATSGSYNDLSDKVGQSGTGIYSEIFNDCINNIASGNYAHAEGCFTIASGRYQHVQGKFNIEDTENKYAHIVGNGINEDLRFNAHTVDWNGNGWFAGDVYVHALDENGDYVDKLATESYVNQLLDSFAAMLDAANREVI